MPENFPVANQWPPEPTPPPPYNVERLAPIHSSLAPIHTSTAATNDLYQRALAGTVWRFYQLVMTQWPVPKPATAPTVDPRQSGQPDHTFPGIGAKSAFANTSLETFDQTEITASCMACHDGVRGKTDFLWALRVNGQTEVANFTHFGVPLGGRRIQLTPELRKLRELMRRNANHEKPH